MEVFEGTVRLAGDSGSLQAVLLVADNRLKVKASHHEIGDWQLSDLYSRIRPDGCHIVAEGEELIVAVEEPMRFAEAIGPSVSNPGDGSLLGADPRTEQQWLERGRRRVGSWMTAFPTPWKVAGAALLIAAVLSLTAPLVLGAVLMVAGLVALIAGGYALMDPFTAVRLPDPLSPPRLIRGGAVALTAAIVLSAVT